MPYRVLRIDASARSDASRSRRLTDRLVEGLRARHDGLDLKVRDLAVEPPPFVDAAFAVARGAAPDDQGEAERAALAASDRYIEELRWADAVVIATPIYNFAVPASLKAWLDMVARARVTFRYTPDGPEGLLRGKRAYIVVASGGTKVGGPNDFATPYLRHMLKFIGITDVQSIAADALSKDAAGVMRAAEARIDALTRPRETA